MMRQTIVEYLTWLIDKFKYPEVNPELELLYFNSKGLAECSRQMLQYKDINFTDTRINKERFDEIKESLPYGQVPILHIDDETVAQSKAIARYVGKLARVYPQKNILHAAFVDEWMELHTEFMFPLALNMYPEKYGLKWSDTQKKEHRKWCIQSHITKYMTYINNELECNKFLGGMDSVSCADFCWVATLEWLMSGVFDGITQEFFDDYDFIRIYILTFNTETS